MKRTWTVIGVCLLVAALANLVFANGKEPKPGPLTGTWECVAHSSVQGDVPFTLKLEQTKEAVTGTLTNSSGEYPLSSASYKKGVLEFHLDAPDGRYVATGKLLHGQLSGHWSKGEEVEGGWEGKKSATAKPHP
jgi:hypothetical protein